MKVLQIENEKIFQNTNSKNFANLVGTNCDFDLLKSLAATHYATPAKMRFYSALTGQEIN